MFTDQDLIYLDGNSLGRLPAAVPTWSTGSFATSGVIA